MAKIVLGIATSHTPMLNTPAKDWPSFIDRDGVREFLDKEGDPATYEELLTRADPRALPELTPELRQAIQENDRPPFTIQHNGDKVTRDNSSALLGYVLEDAKKEFTITRFKGLGEMNPEQLWNTTMNAEARTLLKVRLEDAVAAETIFSTLMGENVEERRKFIEENALDVVNLDI